MTVTYTAEVATCRGFGCFLKLLIRWKASVYKLVWMDLTLFLFVYYSVSGTYRLLLDDQQKKTFEQVVEYCHQHSTLIPLSFVLGFYVTIVMNRWWNQYTAIPWPDSIAVFVSATIHGNDERGRLMRRTIVRYVCVCLTLVLTSISPRVKKRFPTLDHFVDAGLLLESELLIFQSLNAKFPKPSKHWLPIVWASSIVTRARKEGRIRDDFAVKTLVDELNKFRGHCGTLIQYDNISIPLVYTQVVTLAVYTYFLTSVIGQQWTQNESAIKIDGQWVQKEGSKIDLYFPVFTTLEFFFYMGWLKVAETLINPFGDDDDDFEVNWIVDRNLQVSYLIVDEMHHEHPELIRDQYWEEVFPSELPYTAAAEPFREEHPMPSTAGIQLSAAQQELQPSSIRIDEMTKDYQQNFRNDIADDATSGIHFVASSGKLSRSGSRVSHRDRQLSTSIGSTPSNIGGSLTRINSVTNVLKRIFSKEDKPDGSGMKTPGRIPNAESSASLKHLGQGSMRIGVIEEVDEQMTMTSIRPEHRPHVQSIFPQGPPPPSAPVDVPGPATHNGGVFSASCPTTGMVGSGGSGQINARYLGAQMSVPYRRSSGGYEEAIFDADNESLQSNSLSTGSHDDEFSKLKSRREKQRKEKVLQRLSRSISHNRAVGEACSTEDIYMENLLADLAESSKQAMESSGTKKEDA